MLDDNVKKAYDSAPSMIRCSLCHRSLSKIGFFDEEDGLKLGSTALCKECKHEIEAKKAKKTLAIDGRRGRKTKVCTTHDEDPAPIELDIQADNKAIIDRAKVLQDYQDYELTNELHRRGFSGTISKNIQFDI